jgi:hypothetical protein
MWSSVDMNRGPENYNSATKFTITEAKAVTSGGSTTCTIAQVVMEGPSGKRSAESEKEEPWALDYSYVYST